MNNTLNVAKEYALKLGMYPCVSGYTEFCEAVEIFVHSKSRPTLKNVCERIGEARSLGAEAVFRAIAYALKTARNIAENLSSIVGIHVQEEDIRPKFVICLVAQCIEHDLAEQTFFTA